MTEFVAFGNPNRFEIAVRWASDGEPRARRPARHGWSVGDLKITVAGQILTHSRRGESQQRHVGWYLSPVFDWMAANWIPLLHEEDFAWNEKSAAPAVIACHRALDRWIATRDAEGKGKYKEAQRWYQRHAIRSAAEGGLLPDLFIRRFQDDVELSWSAEPPLFAPDGFKFVADPGVARLPVDEVAAPLWEALGWCSSIPPELGNDDLIEWQALVKKIDRLPSLTSLDLDRAYVSEELLAQVRASLDRIGHLDLMEDQRPQALPFVRELSPAVAMFGAVSPNLGAADITNLCQLLAKQAGGHDDTKLASLVMANEGLALGIPHEDGYLFAEEFLAEIGLPGDKSWIDIRAIVKDLRIEVIEQELVTDSIRGVAIAGEGFGSVIVINTTSPFNTTEYGKRFTIAHELCHIIFDRTRARRVAHVSGQWAPPGIERRANAFAAYVLMPRELLLTRWSGRFLASAGEFSAFSQRLRVNETALIEHLYNLELIDEIERERLRTLYSKIQ